MKISGFPAFISFLDGQDELEKRTRSRRIASVASDSNWSELVGLVNRDWLVRRGINYDPAPVRAMNSPHNPPAASPCVPRFALTRGACTRARVTRKRVTGTPKTIFS